MSSTLEVPTAIPKKLHGYEEHTTDALVAELSAVRDELAAECESLRRRVEELEAELEKRASYDRSIRDVFVSAERESRLRRSQAEQEAAAIVEQARAQVAVDPSLGEEKERIRARIAAIHALEQDLRESTKALLLEALRRLDEGADAPSAPAIELVPAAEGDPAETGLPAPAATENEAETALAAQGEATEIAPKGALPLADAPAPSVEDDTIDMPVVAAPEEASAVAGPAEPAAVPAPAPEEPIAAAQVAPIPPASAGEATVAAFEVAEEPSRSRTPGARRSRLAATLATFGILAIGAAVALLIWQLRSDSDPAETSAATPAQTIAGETTAEAPAETPAPAAEATTQAADVSGETAVSGGETAASGGETSASEAPVTEPSGSEAPAEAPAAGAQAEPQGNAAATVVLRAAGGDCWLSVRRGSANGELLFEGFLFQGETRRFEAPRVWMRIGNPANLVARLDGKRLDLPSGTADVLITSKGVQTLALG